MHTSTGVELVSGGVVTENFFQTLGVQPERGSWFHAGSPSAAHEIVISHGFSQRVFGGSVAIGQSLTLDGIFGMNFSQMPLIHHPLGFVWALGIMAAAAATILWWLKKRQWL